MIPPTSLYIFVWNRKSWEDFIQGKTRSDFCFFKRNSASLWLPHQNHTIEEVRGEASNSVYGIKGGGCSGLGWGVCGGGYAKYTETS